MLKGNLFLLGHLSFGLNISVDRVARKPVLIQSTLSVPNDIYRIIVTFGVQQIRNQTAVDVLCEDRLYVKRIISFHFFRNIITNDEMMGRKK